MVWDTHTHTHTKYHNLKMNKITGDLTFLDFRTCDNNTNHMIPQSYL